MPRSTGAKRAGATAPPRPDQPAAWAQPVLLVATGSAGTFWFCYLESSQVVHSLSWLFLAVVLASWPAYLTWRHCTKADRRARAREVYEEGYVDGYLQGVSDRVADAESQEVP